MLRNEQDDLKNTVKMSIAYLGLVRQSFWKARLLSVHVPKVDFGMFVYLKMPTIPFQLWCFAVYQALSSWCLHATETKLWAVERLISSWFWKAAGHLANHNMLKQNVACPLTSIRRRPQCWKLKWNLIVRRSLMIAISVLLETLFCHPPATLLDPNQIRRLNRTFIAS